MEFMQAGLGLVYPEPNILNCWVWFLHPRLTTPVAKSS